MITKWKLFNFKSIRDETSLELGPLTLFAGSNSSGKSSVLQSMLLISQTLASRVSSRSVVLNGPLTKLGQFDDLRSFGSEANQILLGWEIEPHYEENVIPARLPISRRRRSLKKISCEISFDVDSASPQRDLMQLIPRLFGCNISTVTRRDDSSDETIVISISRSGPQGEKIRQLEIQEPENEALLTSLEYNVALEKNIEDEHGENLPSMIPIGCTLRHFLPNRLTMRYDEREQKAFLVANGISDGLGIYPYARRDVESNTIIPDDVIELMKTKIDDELFSIITYSAIVGANDETKPDVITLQEWMEGIRKLSPAERNKLRRIMQENEADFSSQIYKLIMEREERKYGVKARVLPSDLDEGIRYLESFYTTNLRYLGPLRDEPKPLYPLAPTIDPYEIGLKGEYTAAVLNLNKDRRVNYLPSLSFVNPQVKQEIISRTLETAVVDWLQYMGVAEQLSTKDQGKLGHELKVATEGTTVLHDLTHVGVGISQVLPILVLCLLAQPDTTLIIEQPELHLHPKVQTLLADFFLSMAILGKQCVIETHSEYIINRLRFRAAAANEDSISNLIKTYFVDKKKGNSVFREVAVNKYGAIVDWPDGFFDQSQSEAEEILRAATLKRKKERK